MRRNVTEKDVGSVWVGNDGAKVTVIDVGLKVTYEYKSDKDQARLTKRHFLAYFERL